MNDDAPFPPALPAVVPSPIGPAISYSNIRAVTSRAESLLNRLENKIKKKIQDGINHSGMVGAMMESKVRQRIADNLAPHEQLFENLVDHIKNQIAGNLAPAVATLEDFGAGDGTTQQMVPTTETAGVGTPVVRSKVPPVEAPLTPSPLRGPLGLQRQLQRATGQVAGGPRISPVVVAPQQPVISPLAKIVNEPAPSPCDDEALLQEVLDAGTTAASGTPAGAGFSEQFIGQIDCPGACLIAPAFGYTGGQGGVTQAITFGITGTPDQIAAGLAAMNAALAQYQVAGDCAKPKGGGGPPTDGGGTPPTCPPNPCVTQITCPPPLINIPPCPTLKLPSCLEVDLCDWSQLCSVLQSCIPGANPQADCALDNETAYTYKDCDGVYGQAQSHFLAGAGATLSRASTIDDLATSGMQLSTSIHRDEYGSNEPW